MKDWRKSKLLFWTVWLLVFALLIIALQQIDFILNPLVGIMSGLFTPLLIAGFLYYLMNPIVKLLEKIRIKRIWGTILVLILLIGLVAITVVMGIPMLVEQASNVVSGIPDFIAQLEVYTERLAEEPWMEQFDITSALDSFETWLRTVTTQFLTSVVSGVGSAIQTFTDIAFISITVPVILFYMLHDGDRFVPLLLGIVPAKYKKYVKEMLVQTNITISSYISGKGMASLIVGGILFILYTIVGIPSAFLLAVFSGITNFIPYVGPFIGAAPAVLVGLIESPAYAVLAALFVLGVQQLDSNLLTPLFVGRSLSIHPLTVILVLLASANIAGLVGMLIGVPVFAIIKTVSIYLIKMYNENKKTQYAENKNN